MGVKTEYKTPQRILSTTDRGHATLTRKEILFELAPRHHLVSVKAAYNEHREYNLFFPWMYFVVDAWMLDQREYNTWMNAPRSTNGYVDTHWQKGNSSITRIGIARTKQELKKGKIHQFVFPNMYMWSPCHTPAYIEPKKFPKMSDLELAETAVHKWWQLGFNTDIGENPWKTKNAWHAVRDEVKSEMSSVAWRDCDRFKRLNLLMERWESKGPKAIMDMPYPGRGISLTGFASGNFATVGSNW